MENDVGHDVGGVLRPKSRQRSGVQLCNLADALADLRRGQAQSPGDLADLPSCHRLQVSVHHLPQVCVLHPQHLDLLQQAVLQILRKDSVGFQLPQVIQTAGRLLLGDPAGRGHLLQGRLKKSVVLQAVDHVVHGCPLLVRVGGPVQLPQKIRLYGIPLLGGNVSLVLFVQILPVLVKRGARVISRQLLGLHRPRLIAGVLQNRVLQIFVVEHPAQLDAVHGEDLQGLNLRLGQYLFLLQQRSETNFHRSTSSLVCLYGSVYITCIVPWREEVCNRPGFPAGAHASRFRGRSPCSRISRQKAVQHVHVGVGAVL